MRSAGGAVLAAAAVWAGTCVVTYRRALGRHRRGAGEPGGTPANVDVAHELLPLRTEDGVDLLAWYLPGTLTALVVVSGGHRGRAGDVLGIAAALQRAGLHVVVHGWRGTPGSGRAAHTLGDHERRDLRAALDAAVARAGPGRVGLLGYSLGGAVAISVAAEDTRVASVCADSAFAAARDVLDEGVERVLRIPGGVISWPVAAALRLRTGARLETVRPIDAVQRLAPRPLLLIHGGRDLAVGVGNARRLQAAAGGGAELWIVEDCDHAGAYAADRSAYTARVVDFFLRTLTEPGRRVAAAPPQSAGAPATAPIPR